MLNFKYEIRRPVDEMPIMRNNQIRTYIFINDPDQFFQTVTVQVIRRFIQQERACSFQRAQTKAASSSAPRRLQNHIQPAPAPSTSAGTYASPPVPNRLPPRLPAPA